MRKFSVVIVLVVSLLLSGCTSTETVYNFKIRKDNYIISEDKQVLIDYKTNENGELVELFIDRLLTIEDFIHYNASLDYEVEVEGYSGDVYTEAGFLCTTYDELYVPINIEVGNVRFKYNYADCEYVEVDRDNDEKTGRLVRRYGLAETIDVSRDTIVSIVVFNEDSIERFIEVVEIPTTVRTLGVFSVDLNLDRDGFVEGVNRYYRDIVIYEQLLLKYQENESAVSEINGISANINLLEIGDLTDIVPLIEDFTSVYSEEMQAFDELYDEIGVITEEEVTGDDNPNEPDPTDDEGTDSI